MKCAVLAALSLPFCSFAADTNPLGKVIDLVSSLEAKVTKEGEVEAKAYAEFVEWCDDAAKNVKFTIQTASADKEKLTAKIAELESTVGVETSQIEEMASAIASAESELKDASVIRKKEAADFSESEKELMDTIDTLDRAIGLVEKEMSKNPAALAQVSTTSDALSALSTVLDAAAFPGDDHKRLQALLQSRAGDAEDLDESLLGAPAAATYKSHSSNIVEVLEDMKEKAEGQLSDLRKAEKNTQHNFNQLKQSIEDQKAADTKDMNQAKSAKAAAEEAKATGEGDLENTARDLATAKEQLETSNGACMTTAADHEATMAARAEELKVLAEAKKILTETSSGAVSQSYSMLQVVSKLRTRADLARSEVITMVRNLAKKEHSTALSQLASRMAAVVKFGAGNGADPFAKVKGLIGEMITKLESEADAEATEKAYCDEQMMKTEEKKGELDEDVAKMTAKIDQAAARSAELKGQVKELQSELAALAKAQAEMDKIRAETHEDFVTAKKDLELGLSGVRKALSVLREYYGGGAAAAAMLQESSGDFMKQPAMPEHHNKAQGAGDSIIGILEVVESDFATNLAKEETEEEDAQSEYDKITQENKITKTTKDQDVKYKTQESKQLDTSIAEISADRETTSNELSAVLEYYAKVKDRCIAKPETYEERKRRRTAEIEGLKQALATLEDETALVQLPKLRRRGAAHLRGALTPS